MGKSVWLSSANQRLFCFTLVFQRSGEVCLIEIPAFMDRVENRDTLFQEVGRVSCAFDLPDRPVRDAGRLQEMTLSGPQRQSLAQPSRRKPSSDNRASKVRNIAYL